jgi:hypothetical protein
LPVHRGSLCEMWGSDSGGDVAVGPLAVRSCGFVSICVHTRPHNFSN